MCGDSNRLIMSFMVAFLISVFSLFSCSVGTKVNGLNPATQDSWQEDGYGLLAYQTRRNVRGTPESIVLVRLAKKKHKKELLQIASKITSLEQVGFKNGELQFYLLGQMPGYGAWATVMAADEMTVTVNDDILADNPTTMN